MSWNKAAPVLFPASAHISMRLKAGGRCCSQCFKSVRIDSTKQIPSVKTEQNARVQR